MAERSDIIAKKYFAQFLKTKGYDEVWLTSSPTDVKASKNGEDWYFELKMTSEQKSYFGAATETEWNQAYKDPTHFRFVVVQKNGDTYRFVQYTPEEFEKFSTIPPFKVYFNIKFGESDSKWEYIKEENIDISKEKSIRKKNSVKLDKTNFEILHALMDKMRKNQNTSSFGDAEK